MLDAMRALSQPQETEAQADAVHAPAAMHDPVRVLRRQGTIAESRSSAAAFKLTTPEFPSASAALASVPAARDVGMGARLVRAWRALSSA